MIAAYGWMADFTDVATPTPVVAWDEQGYPLVVGTVRMGVDVEVGRLCRAHCVPGFVGVHRCETARCAIDGEESRTDACQAAGSSG